jgi:hypothetical protein
VKAHVITLAAVLAAGLPSGTTLVFADNALRPERIPNKARELADKGRKHHNAGDYTAAVAAFKEAYVLAPSPVLLFNIAQAYRLAGNCDEAAWMYRRFLDTDPRGPQRALAENHHASVEKCGSGGLRVSVEPPKLEAKATAPAAEEPVRITKDVPSPRTNKYKRAAAYTAAGGGALLIGAALFAIDSRNASRAVEDTYRRGGKWEDVEPLDERGQRSATFATVLGIGGGVAMVSAAVLYGLGRHYESNHIAVTPTKDGAQVSMSWGF